jgi:two-component system, NarL family, nitrate/nitrite response regulator NarL
MTARIATIIIEPHSLVRGALEDLMEGSAYRVVFAVGSIAEIGGPSVGGNAIKLAILGAQNVDDAVSSSADIRKLWPDSKIVLLYESASDDDVQILLASGLDGCVSLLVSPATLLKTLDVVVIGDARVMVMAGAHRHSIQPARIEGLQQPQSKEENVARAIRVEPKPFQIASLVPTNKITVNGDGPVNGSGATHLKDHGEAHSRRLPKLSEREAQILDSLVKGYANKVIARNCEITEATVKVHMKSILRKIQVANRTQAAIWAIEHGYSADEIEERLLNAAEA